MPIILSKDPAALVGDNGQPIQRFSFGVGWDVSSGGQKGLIGKFNRMKGVDLDASVIVFDRTKEPIACAFFDNLSVFGGAVRHTGDNKTGKGDGPDETIEVDLDRLPPEAATLVCVLSSYKGASFEKVNNATCEIIDLSNNQTLATVYLPIVGDHTAAFLARITRQSDGTWAIAHMKDFGHGRTWMDLAIRAKSYI